MGGVSQNSALPHTHACYVHASARADTITHVMETTTAATTTQLEKGCDYPRSVSLQLLPKLHPNCLSEVGCGCVPARFPKHHDCLCSGRILLVPFIRVRLTYVHSNKRREVRQTSDTSTMHTHANTGAICNHQLTASPCGSQPKAQAPTPQSGGGLNGRERLQLHARAGKLSHAHIDNTSCTSLVILPGASMKNRCCLVGRAGDRQPCMHAPPTRI